MAFKTKRFLELVSKYKKLINLIFILIICLNFGFNVYQYKSRYFDYKYWENFKSLEKIFLDSQYVNKHAKGFIPDETAFSYSGGKLIKGTSPVLVVPDAPPLGKYLIGLSTLIFNNDAMVVLIFGVLSLIFLYFLSKQILNDSTLALIPVTLLSFEAIFKNQFVYTPLMDVFQLCFLIGTFYFFNKGLASRSLLNFSLANLFLGFFIATKFFISGFTIIAAWYLVLFFMRDKKKLIHLTITLPISLFVLLFSYIRVFAFGYTFSKFLGIQRWVFDYHKSFLILPLSVWPLLLLNKWYVWFGNKPVISDPQWSITWPILTIGYLIILVLYLLKLIPHKTNINILLTWVFVYLVFLSTGQVFSRYFVILIPILYIILIYGVVNCAKLIGKKK